MARARTVMRSSSTPRRAPNEIVKSLDEQRQRARQFIDQKRQALAARGFDSGDPLAPMRYRSAIDAWTRRYRNAVIMYHDGSGTAFALTKSHLSTYLNMKASSPLGYLVSDGK